MLYYAEEYEEEKEDLRKVKDGLSWLGKSISFECDTQDPEIVLSVVIYNTLSQLIKKSWETWEMGFCSERFHNADWFDLVKADKTSDEMVRC